MAYVVVAFAIINSAILAWAVLMVLSYGEELGAIVETAIQDEVRKQDDRIEKRLAKREGPPGNGEEPLALPTDGKIEVGRPHRR